MELLGFESATKEDIKTVEDYAENNEYSSHTITLQTVCIAQFPVNQIIWEVVMGYNKSYFKYKEEKLPQKKNTTFNMVWSNVIDIMKMWSPLGVVGGTVPNMVHNMEFDKGHFPVESITHDEAMEFVRRLSKMTNIQFALPQNTNGSMLHVVGKKVNTIDTLVATILMKSHGIVTMLIEVRSLLVKSCQMNLAYMMCGNIREWTETPARSYSIDIKPEGTCFIRRDGSWWHEEKNCRVSRRYASDHTKKISRLGLRLVIRK